MVNVSLLIGDCESMRAQVQATNFDVGDPERVSREKY